jgi:hypothetical protein
MTTARYLGQRRSLALILMIVVQVAAALPVGAVAGAKGPQPISTTPPAWFTPHLAARLLRDGYAPLPPAAANSMVGVTTPGIHPAQWLQTISVTPPGPSGGGITSETCTAGFVFRRRSRLGLGAAGHCAPLNARVSAYVLPPVGSGSPPGLYLIGRVIRSSGDHAAPGSDFSLIRIDRRFNAWVDPRMPFWGGPTKVYRGSAPAVVTYVGHGAAGLGGAPRAGFADSFESDGYSFVGPSGPGDSGGAVLTADGRAAGNQTHLVPPEPPSRPGIVVGTRVDEMLRQASGWRLVMAPT